MNYRLNIDRLHEIAGRHGDHNAHAIARRTGINVSSAYRIHSGEAQPDLINALRLSVIYDFDLREVVDEIDDTDDTQTEAAA